MYKRGYAPSNISDIGIFEGFFYTQDCNIIAGYMLINACFSDIASSGKNTWTIL